MSIDDYRDHAEINCGPTRHHACACREAAVAKLVEALKSIAAGCNVQTCEGTIIARAALDEWEGRVRACPASPSSPASSA